MEEKKGDEWSAGRFLLQTELQEEKKTNNQKTKCK